MGDNYIISARKRTGDALIAEPGPIKFLKVPSTLDSYDARQAVSSAKDWVAEVQGLADGDENPNSIGPRGDVLIFVHGYNNDIPTVLKRIRQLRSLAAMCPRIACRLRATGISRCSAGSCGSPTTPILSIPSLPYPTRRGSALRRVSVALGCRRWSTLKRSTSIAVSISIRSIQLRSPRLVHGPTHGISAIGFSPATLR